MHQRTRPLSYPRADNSEACPSTASRRERHVVAGTGFGHALTCRRCRSRSATPSSRCRKFRDLRRGRLTRSTDRGDHRERLFPSSVAPDRASSLARRSTLRLAHLGADGRLRAVARDAHVRVAAGGPDRVDPPSDRKGQSLGTWSAHLPRSKQRTASDASCIARDSAPHPFPLGPRLPQLPAREAKGTQEDAAPA